MQSGRADDALACKLDDARRDDVSAALIYLKICARQFESDRHGQNCFRAEGVGSAQVSLHRHGGYLPL